MLTWEKLEYLTRDDEECKKLGYLMAADFKLFVKVFFFYIYGINFVFKGFHDILFSKLVSYAKGDNERRHLVVNIPPRSGKTTTMTFFSAWTFCRNPRSKIIYTSYADDLATGVSDGVKGVIKSDLYRRCFPHIKVKKSRDSKEYWEIDEFNGSFFATPTGGKITGFGAGVLGSKEFSGFIGVDDPIKIQEIGSEVIRRKVIDYYADTLKSRFNNPNVPFFIIMQRVHPDDLVGYILQTPEERCDYNILKIAACDEECNDIIWPEQWTRDFFLKLKKTRKWTFYSQYLQEPIIRGGGVINIKCFRYYDDCLNDLINVFITADTAYSTKQVNDYSVFCVWGKDKKQNLYLLDMYRGKWESPQLVEIAMKVWQKWRIGRKLCTCMYIENRGSGTSLIQWLNDKTGIPILPITPVQDKLTRLELVLPFIESGKVFLPRGSAITEDFLSECEMFSKDMSHSHDDIVDNLTMAVDVVQGSSSIPAHAIL